MKALILTALCLMPNLTQAADLTGIYEKGSVVHLPSIPEDCQGENMEYDSESGFCIYRMADGNRIEVARDTVSVQTLFGAAHERSFEGRIVKRSKYSVVARDAEGCKIKVELNEKGLASSTPSSKCDPRLALDNVPKIK